MVTDSLMRLLIMQVYQNRLELGALLFDMDNDGYKDIYVCNGIYQQIKILLISSRMNLCKMVVSGKKEQIETIINRMPSTYSNYAFKQ
jgi:hypothetical protein